VAHRFPELGLKGIVFRLSGNDGVQKPTVSVGGKNDLPEQDNVGLEALAGSETQKRLEDIEDPEFRALLSDLRKTILGNE
jgi:hypothetical protein